MQTYSINPNRAPNGFWFLSALLVFYVASSTGFRDQIPEADAWEHHRAILALTEDLRHPGNPTYASDIPSVRYSPYTIALALLSRATHLDPYKVLSFAAVLNTILLCLGVWLLLRSFQQSASSGAVLLVMVGLYGQAPAYANSYALADLPWQQVNPSAFSFGLTLIAWSIWRRCLIKRLTIVSVGIVALMMTCVMIDHPMTGVFGMLGLLMLVVTAPTERRIPAAGALSAIGIVVAGLCLAWPWYSFLDAVRWNHDNAYWYDRHILTTTLTLWCAPAALCSLLALPLRKNPLVRTCFIGGFATIVLGLSAFFTHSATFTRLPLAGLIYFHIAVGVFLHQSGALRLRTWREFLASKTTSRLAMAPPIAVLILLAFLLFPQVQMVVNSSHLARAYFAPLLHRRDIQRHDRALLADLLQPIGQHDVVLSDMKTSWKIPSERGRIVAAWHYELFVPDQPRRTDDLATFFATSSEAERDQIIDRYHVRWIVVNREVTSGKSLQGLLRRSSIVRQSGPYTLMQSERWVAAGAQQSESATTSATDP